MTGTVDHPIIEVNKKGAKDAFEQEETGWIPGHLQT